MPRSPRIPLLLPEDLRALLDDAATKGDRTLTAEIVRRLRASFEGQSVPWDKVWIPADEPINWTRTSPAAEIDPPIAQFTSVKHADGRISLGVIACTGTRTRWDSTDGGETWAVVPWPGPSEEPR